MAFQILFGDDEHTAKDGPYSRVLKTRKWIYISAALAVILSLDLYRPDKTADLLQVANLPPGLIGSALLVGGTYLLIQYGLLLYQLFISYDLILAERLTFRRADDLNKAQERVRAAYDEAGIRVRKARDELESDLAEVEKAIFIAEKELDEKELDLRRLEGAYDSTATLKRDQAKRRIEFLKTAMENGGRRAEQLRDKISAHTFGADDPDDVDIQEAVAALNHLRAQNPADRKGYKAMEISIDVLRLVPPLVIGLGSVTRLGWWFSH